MAKDDEPAPAGRRIANARHKRNAVRRAAIELSEELGYPAVTMAGIAERSGVAERTIFRTFQTKAGIFWSDPLLQRIAGHVDEGAAVEDPLEALKAATSAAARAMTADEQQFEARRRALVLAEPELQGIGSRTLGRDIGALVARMTPGDATQDQRKLLALFGLFAAMAIAFEPLVLTEPIDAWISRLHGSLDLAAYGPLRRIDSTRPESVR